MRYLGCKTILLDWIDSIITELGIGGGVFADLFTGTTTVAQHFKTKGFQLITNDMMSFSYVFQQAYIATNQLPQFEKLQASQLPLTEPDSYANISHVISFLNHIEPAEGFLYKHYTLEGTSAHNTKHSRQYFSTKNAQKLDAIRNCIESWRMNHLLSGSEYYLLVAAVIEAASAVSNTAGTYGAFLKDWDSRALKPVVLAVPNVITSSFDHQVFMKDANELVKEIVCDVMYLDPPYNQRQYAAYYHLLDTIASWDEPKVYGKTGRRPYSHQLSRYCTPDAGSALAELVRNASCKHILVSYNNEGILSPQEIWDILALRGRPSVYEYDYRRYSSHAQKSLKQEVYALAEDNIDTEGGQDPKEIYEQFDLMSVVSPGDVINLAPTQGATRKAPTKVVKELVFYVQIEK